MHAHHDAVESRNLRVLHAHTRANDRRGHHQLGDREYNQGLRERRRLHVCRNHNLRIRCARRWQRRPVRGARGPDLSSTGPRERSRRRRLAQLVLLSLLPADDRVWDGSVHIVGDRQLPLRGGIHLLFDSVGQGGYPTLRAGRPARRPTAQPPGLRVHRPKRRCVGDPAGRGASAEGSERLSGQRRTCPSDDRY